MTISANLTSGRRRYLSSRRDDGTTFVELLVTIVLLGTAVVAALASLRLTVIGSTTERDHARAHQWLQSAVGAVREADYVRCDDDGSGPPDFLSGLTPQDFMKRQYEAAIAADTTPPPAWTDSQLSIVLPIKVWDGTRYWDPNDVAAPDTCFKDEGFSLQLLTIEVQSIDGDIIESVQVVKSD